MKFTKHLVTAAVLAALGTAAQAQNILTVVNGGATFTGSGALTFSADLLGALDTPQRSATGRRPCIRRAVGRPGGLPRLVPDRLPVAVFRLQPARWPTDGARPRWWHVADFLHPGPDRCADLQRYAPGAHES